MSRAARSVFVFGMYLLVLGTWLIVAPNALLDLFGIQNTREVWLRVLGVILLYVGTYYIVAGRNEVTSIFRVSIPVRFSLVIFLAVFVALDYVEPIVVLFAGGDAAGALWTLLALRQKAGTGS